MDFQTRKKLPKKDRSNIGSWDVKIKGLCEKINNNKNYFTTSSCSGRVILMKSSVKKIKDIFLFRTHDKIGFNELKKALEMTARKYSGLVEFQLSSCILHVDCKSFEDAQKLVNKAKESGWKRSGLMTSKKRFIVELQSTEGISFPVMDKGEMLVDDNFLKIVVREANRKLVRTWDKIKRLKVGV